MIRPKGSSVATKISLAFGLAEPLEVDEDAVLVGQGQGDLLDLGAGVQRGLAHRVQGLLDGQAVVAGEGLQQGPADPGVGRVPVDGGPRGVGPAGPDLGGEDPVGRLGEGRVAVAEEAREARAGGLEDQQAVQPRLDPEPVAARGVTVAVRVSPPPPTKAWGWSTPPTAIRRQGCSASPTVAERTWGYSSTKCPARAAPKSSIASAGRPWARA